ncbi:Nup85 Nucleoporin [Teratosphaeria destructans]|uniref:Nuclear pore complex protein Nup85 n=1 Tax=Teratosphaeria destructans TaxID=418781 RepID=A0A9W7W030_9PEZI|nr:Nup85 Nucleoporin [Teratosphaeria destructans]
MSGQFRFGVPSDSPTTPKRKGNAFQQSHPSTTPAGPPPSQSYYTNATNASTTPAGPPPRSVYGSSALGNTFGRRGNTPARRGFMVPESSPPRGDEDEDEDAEGEEDDEVDGLRQYDPMPAPRQQQPQPDAFMSSIMSSPRGLKRSRNGRVRESVASQYPDIARGITSQGPAAALQEPDDVVLKQEEVLAELDRLAEQRATFRDASITERVAELSQLWQKYANKETKEAGVGPEANDGFSKASYVASLLLSIHHPHSGRSTRPSRQIVLSKRGQAHAASIPRALLDWLDTYHNPFPDDFDVIWRAQPSATAHDRFWDCVFACIVRGKYDRASRLLSEAQWEHAATADEDLNEDNAQYSEGQLESIEHVIGSCVSVIQASPAFKYEDWDVKGGQWAAFRQVVRQAYKDLEIYAGDQDGGEAEAAERSTNVFGESMSMSTQSRKAESKVPWTIYENLKLLYGILLGHEDEIIDTSQDWLEAAVYLTVWWDGEDSSAADLSRSQNLRKASQKTREVDIAPSSAYRKRLTDAFLSVTDVDESVFTVKTIDPVQVALSCIMVDNIESVISVLRTWSLGVTSAVIEVAAIAGWLPQARARGKYLQEQGFSSEDLMVLSHGPGQGGSQRREVERDEVLSEYANLLAEKAELKSQDGRVVREGWDLAIAVLGRLDDSAVSSEQIRELLDRIELTDETRVDNILAACSAQGLSEQARAIAERYADSLATSISPQATYGSALIYYARAHATAKLKNELAYLNSLCLFSSSAVPATADLDPQLASLLSRERVALIGLARADPDAADILASHLSGYATLRRFYELRDQDGTASSSGKIALKPLERKREAAKALIAVATSAADCIQGGLFDPQIESVVPIDGVLVLLGECLPLLGQPKRIFTKEHVFTLLRLVEDLSAAPGRIKENAQDLLRSSMVAYHDGQGSGTGRHNLRSSRKAGSASGSGFLGGSGYDMLASSAMLRSQESLGRGGDVTRAWDWRKGLDAVASGSVEEVGEKEVLGMLRAALSLEVARGWSGELIWS